MFGNAFTLFRIFGFEVRANVSWLFLAILVTWSLAAGFFPTVYPDLRLVTYWLLGLAGMVGLFFSLLFHELSHSLVARSRGLPMTGITLFLFGGVAEMAMEPRDAKTEFWIAIAGPIASVVLAGFFYIVAVAMAAAGFPEHITGVPQYLGFINLLLAAFNMLPGFPLDGGRVLRAALWHWSGNLTWATRWASRLGQVFGLLLVALGVLSAFAGNFVGGIWWLLIGLFLQGAATAAYQRLLQENALKGQTVRRLMSDDPTTVPADISVAAFVEDYLYPHGHDLFPVVSDHRAGRLRHRARSEAGAARALGHHRRRRHRRRLLGGEHNRRRHRRGRGPGDHAEGRAWPADGHRRQPAGRRAGPQGPVVASRAQGRVGRHRPAHGPRPLIRRAGSTIS
jgi:Zn-dependent protease